MLKWIALSLLFFPITLFAQNVRQIKGKVSNAQNQVIPGVQIRIQNTKILTSTNNKGEYQLDLIPGSYILNFSLVGYKSINVEVKLTDAKDEIISVTMLANMQNLGEVVVVDKQNRNEGMILVDPTFSTSNPNISQNFESILKQLPGVSTNNELSSQYTVRGGNFDENLIFIDDIQIFKPYLVRNGQQEGLSLINPELVDQVKFSAGGFAPKYGDKLSSVLDVSYKYSDTSKVIFGIGTNGESLTTFFDYKKFSLAVGYRNKRNVSTLNSQPVVGNYNPEFYDFQALLNWKVSDKTSLSYLGIYNSSKFGLIPKSRVTEFGTFNEVLRLNVNYEGQEEDEYKNFVSAITLKTQLNKNTVFKWINSMFYITERENFDILGNYIFDEVESDFGSGNFGQVKANRGIGAFQNFGRNQLFADVFSSELKLNFNTKKSYWETGLRFQFDKISDELKEFDLIDSAGFSIPNNFDEFQLTRSVEATNSLQTYRIAGYVQNTTALNQKLSFTGGLRVNYNDFTNELAINPRAILSYSPDKQKDIIYRFATGLYSQPPFYREMRNLNGVINPDIKSQKSIHYVLGLDNQFKGLGTQMKFTAEAYFKQLFDITPYNIENLRVRYYANQLARGYATGFDFRISGEFVRDLESSFRLSVMKTAEDIEGDSFIYEDANGNMQIAYPGFIKRPADQRVNFSAFFQDRLFNSPTYKVHLNLLFGSRLPIGPPNSQRYEQVFHIPAYKRLDIGFSKNILDPESTKQPKFLQKHFKAFIIHAEVFNLLNINNTVSYLWITDVNNNQYAIPNYLTSRQLNLRLITKF